MCPTFVQVLSLVASHTCADVRKSAIVNRQYVVLLFTIHASRLAKKVPNVQVSDTTDDAMKPTAGHKKIKMLLYHSPNFVALTK